MDQTKSIGLAYYELVNERRMDDLQALVDNDYVGHGLGGAGGAQAVRRDTEGYITAFPDLQFTIEDVIAEDDRVAVKSTFRGTHQGAFAGVPASGNRIEVGGCDVFRVRNGKIVEGWTLCDSGTLFMQIGAIAAPAAVSPMSTADHKATTRRVLEEFFSGGRLDLAHDLFTADLVQHHPDAPYETRGPDGLVGRIEAWRTAFADLTTSIEDLLAEGDRVAFRSIARGTFTGPFMGAPPTGKSFAAEWESIYRFEDGRVAEMWDAWNVQAIMEQLGLVAAATA